MGLVKITDSINTISSEIAASASAVKKAYDLAANNSGGATVLANYRHTVIEDSEGSVIALTLPTDYNYFRIVITDMMCASTSGTTMQARLRPFNSETQRPWGVYVDETNGCYAAGVRGCLGSTKPKSNTDISSFLIDMCRIGNYMMGECIAMTVNEDSTNNKIGIFEFYVPGGPFDTLTVNTLSSTYYTSASIMMLGVK